MEYAMRNARFWVRVGDYDIYQDFDGLEEVADYFAEMGATDALEWCDEYGFSNFEFRDKNYISLYLGDADAQPVRYLTPEEHDEVNRLLRAAPSSDLRHSSGC
jgi:hypothetical protein